jgi:hypothetical protein
LNTLAFELTVPTPMTFLTRFLKACAVRSPLARAGAVPRERRTLTGGRNKENRSVPRASSAASRAAFFSQNRARQAARRPSVAGAAEPLARFKSRVDLVPHLARYFCQLVILDAEMLRYLPSMVAAAAVLAARRAVSLERPWTGTLRKYCGYGAAELEECVAGIRRLRLLAAAARNESAGEKAGRSAYDRALMAGARNAAEKFSSHQEKFVALLPVEDP